MMSDEPRSAHHSSVIISRSPLINQTGDERGPSRLMRGAQAFAGVAVEVFVEEEQILPVRVMREQLRFACATRTEDGPIAVRIANEDMDETIGEARCQSA